MSASCARGMATLADAADVRILESRRFGPLAYRPEDLVTFPAGLLGFEALHEYAQVSPEGLEPLRFLVSLEDPEVAFPVLPAVWAPADYSPAMPPDAQRVVGAGPDDPIELLLIVTIAPDTGTLHLNLRGPLLINPATRTGCQIVLHDSSYSLRHILTSG